jgi:hypothetical protein
MAMWMVVYSHIVSFSMGHIEPSPLGRFFSTIMLPLFFFISGFCAYKENLTVAQLGKQLLAKTRAILLPTVVMFLLFMLYSGSNPLDVASRYDKGGYWFTWVLFQILLIYLVFCTIASRMKHEWGKWLVLASPLLLFSAFSHLVGFTSKMAVTLELVKVYGYYVYFFLGLFVRRFNIQITAVLSKSWANALLFVAAVISYIEIGGICLVLSVIAVYSLLYQMEDYLSDARHLPSRILNAIGKKTLAIYFFHFFLLFRIPFVPQWLQSMQTDTCFGTHSSNNFVELLICGAIALLLCYACIAIEYVLSKFPIIYEACLGPVRKAKCK